MSICIAGVLRWPDKTLADLFTEPDGQKRTGKYVRDFLKLQQAKGRRVLPMGDDECEGFDYQTGCPGHPIEEPAEYPFA